MAGNIEINELYLHSKRAQQGVLPEGCSQSRSAPLVLQKREEGNIRRTSDILND